MRTVGLTQEVYCNLWQLNLILRRLTLRNMSQRKTGIEDNIGFSFSATTAETSLLFNHCHNMCPLTGEYGSSY